MALANYNLDLTKQGSKVPIIQLKKYMGIQGKSLYRCLHSLESDGLITCTHHGYQTGRESKRWLITDKADGILSNEANIIRYNVMTNEFLKSANEKGEKDFPFQGGNIGYYINYNISNLDLIFPPPDLEFNNHIEKNINFLENLVSENNMHTQFKTISNLRIETDRKGNRRIKGRAFNVLCLLKSGKKTYMKSDKRIMRRDFLNATGHGDYVEVFDIKTQIPRLTYILQGGEYGDIEDFYAVEGLTREMAKMMMLPAYFDRTLGLGRWHSLRKFLRERENKDYKGREEYGVMRNLWYGVFEKTWMHLRGLVEPIGPEIFLWTSIWEHLIIKEARERLGMKILNVYDGFFYTDADAGPELERIAAETSKTVREMHGGKQV